MRSLKNLKRIWLTDSQKMRKAAEKLKEFLPELDIEFVDPEKELTRRPASGRVA